MRTREVHREDRAFLYVLRSLAFVLLLLLASVAFQLGHLAWPAFSHFKAQFFSTSDWDPINQVFGVLPFLYGTLVTSFLALILACPVSVGVAIFLTEVVPDRIARPIGFLVEMLAAIPSIVYGLWGIFVFAPIIREHIAPWCNEHLAFLPMFQGPSIGVGLITASLVLAVMIMPTIAAIAKELFQTVPQLYREGALALGATRTEMILIAVIRSTLPGLMGAVVLGLARALGETMAVTMLIGNRNAISMSLFAPGQTMASLIANEYAEASETLHVSSLALTGVTLLIVSFIIHALARLLVARGGAAFKRKRVKP